VFYLTIGTTKSFIVGLDKIKTLQSNRKFLKALKPHPDQ